MSYDIGPQARRRGAQVLDHEVSTTMLTLQSATGAVRAFPPLPPSTGVSRPPVLETDRNGSTDAVPATPASGVSPRCFTD
ncbi:hypothetical protein GCM10023175_65700 [Pseudonocardia xishanensis]|uniref:Uncharacterized protein n=1 Tax=Pseudonocardia xishanensis TaxID=630995 RepID=A0ABP8S3T3_9PSEU